MHCLNLYVLFYTLQVNLTASAIIGSLYVLDPMPSSVRHGLNERDSSSAPERSSAVILSRAKDLAADRDRPFAPLRVTLGDGSHCQVYFFQIKPYLMYKSVV